MKRRIAAIAFATIVLLLAVLIWSAIWICIAVFQPVPMTTTDDGMGNTRAVPVPAIGFVVLYHALEIGPVASAAILLVLVGSAVALGYIAFRRSP